MKTIRTTDVWTEQFENHFECLNGAFIDGIDAGGDFRMMNTKLFVIATA